MTLIGEGHVDCSDPRPGSQRLHDVLEVRRRELAEYVERRAIQGAGALDAPLATEATAVSLEAPVLEPTTGTRPQLAQATGRLEEGRYGRCNRCGGPVGVPRLHVPTSATYCLPCAIRREQDATRRPVRRERV